MTVPLHPLYITINMLLQIKIGISDTSCQGLVACALRYRPPSGCGTLRHGLMKAMAHDQAALPCRPATFRATGTLRPVDLHLGKQV